MLKVSIEYKVYKVGGAAMYIPMLDPVAVGKAVAFYRNQKGISQTTDFLLFAA